MNIQDFTSLPPNEEAAMVVFEEHSISAGKKAKTAGIVSGAILFVLAVAIYLLFQPPAKSTSKPAAKVPVEAPPAATK